MLIFLIAAVHPRREAPVIRGALFCAFVAFGVAMVRVSRDGAYYAVMVWSLRRKKTICGEMCLRLWYRNGLRELERS